jgi:hypothetical protein
VGIAGDIGKGLPAFPGFSPDRGFFSDLVVDDSHCQLVTTHELDAIAINRERAVRFESAVEHIGNKLRMLRSRTIVPML